MEEARLMNSGTPAIQNLAQRLIALEAARNPSEGRDVAALRACEKLRGPLAKLAGMAGIRSLMARAMALATAKVPWLDSVQVRADGTLDGFDTASKSQQDAVAGDEAAAFVVGQLLGLLVTFIGESLTLGLVRDAWPDAPQDEADWKAEGNP